jgi:hypothetical protein
LTLYEFRIFRTFCKKGHFFRTKIRKSAKFGAKFYTFVEKMIHPYEKHTVKIRIRQKK